VGNARLVELLWNREFSSGFFLGKGVGTRAWKLRFLGNSVGFGSGDFLGDWMVADWGDVEFFLVEI